MAELVLTTYDWIPEPPRGFVRDIRIRWALEEAALPYRVESTPFEERGHDHIAHQPFAQVPWLTDGDLSIFESGAILLHLGGLSSTLMPTDRRARTETVTWVCAALNSIEVVSVPWFMMAILPASRTAEGWAQWDGLLKERLKRLEPILAKREWLAGSFSVADIMMADVLRLTDRAGGLKDHPACAAYLVRATARPAFAKAHADQLAHFAAAD